MVICAVFGCNNSHRTKISLFSFPKDPDLCAKWVQFCKRTDTVNTKNARICAEHFQASDYHWSLQHKLLGYSPKHSKKINPKSVPSVNPPHISSSQVEIKEDVSRVARQKKRNQRKLIKELTSTTSTRDQLDPSPVSSEMPQTIEPQLVASSSNISDDTIIVAPRASSSEITCDKIKRLEAENKRLKATNMSLHIKLQAIKNESNKAAKIKSLLGELFTEGQIRSLLSGRKRVLWSAEDISAAISLRTVSGKAYRYLRNKLHYPLPAVSTLKRWAQKLQCQAGTLDEVLSLMAAKGKMFNPYQKLTVISFDEMKVLGQLCYDHSHDMVIGPYNQAQVIMARGLVGNWKQPIFYDFDFKMTKEKLEEIICRLAQAGYEVVAVVSDMGTSNMGLWNSLGISVDNVSFKNPANPELKIFAFNDAPHLLKLARNHFLDHGFVYNNVIINTDPLFQLLEIVSKAEVRIAHKLTLHHLTVKKAGRQKVKTAAQLFSNSVSKSLTWCGSKGMIAAENWRECGAMLKLFNDWFDVLNCRSAEPDSRDRMKAYGLAITTQAKILEDMTAMMQGMRMNVPGRKSMLPFQKGIIITSRSLRELAADLERRLNVKYILTYRLNQDVLENFFSAVRAAGHLHDHPLPTEFTHRIRNFILGRNGGVLSSKANTETDTTEKMDLLSQLSGPSTSAVHTDTQASARTEVTTIEDVADNVDSVDFISSAMVSSVLDVTELEVDEVSDATPDVVDENFGDDWLKECFAQDVEGAGVTFIAGYLAFRVRDKDRTLGIPTGRLDLNRPEEKEESRSWINHLSEGGLLQPDPDFLAEVQKMDKIFKNFNLIGNKKLEINQEPNYIKKLVEMILPKMNISNEKLVKIFIRTRMYIRIKQINNKLIQEKRDKATKKVKKTVT